MTATEFLLSAKSLTRRFGGVVAVDDFSFDVKSGEILGLIGPNGAGKSTTFNMLTGFLSPSVGEVFWKGKSLRGMSSSAIARLGISRTFQHDSYWGSLTVRENLVLANSQSNEPGGIEHLAAILGLQAVREELACNLPHGHQRLLSLGIGLATKPELLCLDEPLTGLNLTEVNRILELLLDLKKQLGFTLLFVEHNIGAVMKLSDRVVVMNAGTKLAEGTPAEIAANTDVIRAYLGDKDE